MHIFEKKIRVQSVYETILKFIYVCDKVQLYKFLPNTAVFHNTKPVVFPVEVRQNFFGLGSGGFRKWHGVQEYLGDSEATKISSSNNWVEED